MCGQLDWPGAQYALTDHVLVKLVQTAIRKRYICIERPTARLLFADLIIMEEARAMEKDGRGRLDCNRTLISRYVEEMDTSNES